MDFYFYFFITILYAYVSIQKMTKELIILEKKLQILVDRRWDQNFSNEIMYVVGDEWHAGNLSYHLNHRPKWFLDYEK